MRIFVAFLLFVSAISIYYYTSGSNPSTWEAFTSSKGKFSVSFPGHPIENRLIVNDESGRTEAYTFTSKHERGMFAIAYADYPILNNFDVLELKEYTSFLLDSTRDSMVANVKGKLLSEQTISFSGYPGREIKIEAPDGIIALVRSYRIKQRLYVLQVVTWQEKVFSESGLRFLDSFRITGY